MEYWIALIGVLGTLLGTLLGFLLNMWSNNGEIKFVLMQEHIYNGLTKYFDVELFNTNNFPIALRQFKLLYNNKSYEIRPYQGIDFNASPQETPLLREIKIDFKEYDASIVVCDARSRTMVRFLFDVEDTSRLRIVSIKHSKISYIDNNGKIKKKKIIFN